MLITLMRMCSHDGDRVIANEREARTALDDHHDESHLNEATPQTL
jgi:hypothetical protein